MNDTGSNPALSVTERTSVKTDLKTVFVVAGAIILAVSAWVSLKMEVSEHTAQLLTIRGTVDADHDILLELRGSARAQRHTAIP